MAEIHHLRSSAQIRREASEWIARLNADRVSDDDRVHFESWRAQHPSHAREYDEVSATWARLADTGKIVSSVALGQALSASTQRAISKSIRASKQRAWLSTAAALALVSLIAWFWSAAFVPRGSFQTAIGQHASIELPDGSLLELNSNSLARVDYTESSRIIRLQRGEAFFNVAPDAQRPFWVIAQGTWVRAVGTAFNVRVQPAGVSVTVSEGKVKVLDHAPSSRSTPSDEQLAGTPFSILVAGQQAKVQTAAATELRAVAATEITRLVSWRQGKIFFEAETLSNVIRELSRYTTVQMIIEEDSLQSFSIAGTFETNEHGAEALLTSLKDGFGLQVRRKGDVAYISR